MRWCTSGWLACVVGVVAVLAQAAAGIEVRLTQNTQRLMPYQVFELTFQHEGKYADPNWDVGIDVTFTSPSGKAAAVGGFFYGSSRPQKPVIRQWKDDKGRPRSDATWPCDPADLWKARYAPSERGRWTFAYTFRNARGEEARGEGSFEVVEGRVKPKGWVRINPENPFRFVFDDGTPFYPVGTQDGVFDGNNNGSAMDAKSMEGPFRLDPENTRPKPPAGAIFARGPSMNPVNADVYFGRHGRAGFNLWRFSPHNFSLPVFDINRDAKSSKPATIRWEQAVMVDEMLQLTHKYGMLNFYGICGFTPVFNDGTDARGMEKVKRMIKYSVDRWGAYADFWELLNEQKAAEEWYRVTVPYLRSIDPYQRPITTSWERPELAGIEMSAPHWYGMENELSSDTVTAQRAANHKKPGKPVVYGEQGNGGGKPELIPQGIGGVWDPGSATRMRVRLWTAMFSEVSFIFWETSYARDGHSMNQWIGPEERQYVRALQDLSRRLDAGIRMTKPQLNGPQANEVRAYGLRSEQRAAVYLHHGVCAQCRSQAGAHHRWDHDRGQVKDLTIVLDVPRPGKGYWYNPINAAIVGRFDAAAGRQTVSVPAFTVDLALLITDAAAPDIDGDGVPNDLDDDDDNDGAPDAKDAFPLEREEQADVDGDRIGDSLDADINADGVADDLNRNGVPDNEEADWDGDGVPNANAIPWDAFPHDPKEWRDTDGDGIGDNADEDDDGDGFSDEEEKKAGTDPLDPVSFPR